MQENDRRRNSEMQKEVSQNFFNLICKNNFVDCMFSLITSERTRAAFSENINVKYVERYMYLKLIVIFH